MIGREKKIELARWLLDPDKRQSPPSDWKSLEKKLKENGLEKVFEEIELPLVEILETMQEIGIKVDLNYLARISKEIGSEIAVLVKTIYKLAGGEINLNSPKQLSKLLFEKLKISDQGIHKTKTGLRSTDAETLAFINKSHKVVEPILKYREIFKLKSTYVEPLRELADKKGRIHTTFVQTGTGTGRLSSQNPNIQNIPITSEWGKKIRAAFIAEAGYKVAAFDYSQIELRIAAILSGDKKLISIFKEGGDVHAAVAAQIFKVTPDKVDKEMRRRAKVINFGILYGMGVNALRANLGTDRAEAQLFYNTYFETFKTLAAYLETIKADAKRKGYTETLFGRKRYFNALSGSLPFIQAAEERMAVNAPFQGTCADIMKIAMKRVDDYIQKSSLKNDVFLILQVHDELVYEIKSGVLKSTAHEIVHIMESVLTKEESKNIPLIVNASAGESWGDMKLL